MGLVILHQEYVFGIILVAVGFLIVWKSDWLMDNFGRIAWADAKLGTEGGTRLFYKLIGITVIIGSFLYMSGALGGIIRGIFGTTIETVA